MLTFTFSFWSDTAVMEIVFTHHHLAEIDVSSKLVTAALLMR